MLLKHFVYSKGGIKRYELGEYFFLLLIEWRVLGVCVWYGGIEMLYELAASSLSVSSLSVSINSVGHMFCKGSFVASWSISFYSLIHFKHHHLSKSLYFISR